MSQPKTTREVLIIARYYIKKNCTSNGVAYKAGSFVYLVRNDAGKEYLVTIRANGIHSCECPAVKPCYHMNFVQGVHKAREAADAVKVAQAFLKEESRKLQEAETRAAYVTMFAIYD